VVEHAIATAESYWLETGDVAGTAARLAAPISKHQPFMDTNHRTAHTVAHTFLRDGGYEDLAPENDLDLAAILERDRDPYLGVETQIEAIKELFERRLKESGMERLVLDEDTDTAGTAPQRSTTPQEQPRPAPDVVQRQDPSHTRAEFLADLNRATEPVPEEPS
jgi:prophage maintenance system killer protein